MSSGGDPFGASDLRPDFTPGPDGVYYTGYGSPVSDAAYWSAGQSEYSADTGSGGDPGAAATGGPDMSSGDVPGAPLDGTFSGAGTLPMDIPPDVGGGDAYSNTMDPAGLGATQDSLAAMGPNALAALTQAVNDTPPRTVTTASPRSAPGLTASIGETPGTTAQPGSTSPTPINVWSPVSTPGHLAAHLTFTEGSLISALQRAASAAGGQAALMSPTVSLAGDTVSAGGSAAVGARGVPASTLVAGSEYGGAPQFRSGPWFFPAVAAWAAANPPPAQTHSSVPGGQPEQPVGPEEPAWPEAP